MACPTPGRNDNAATTSAWRASENFNVFDYPGQADAPGQAELSDQSGQPDPPEQVAHR